jgi:hypothetical protein
MLIRCRISITLGLAQFLIGAVLPIGTASAQSLDFQSCPLFQAKSSFQARRIRAACEFKEVMIRKYAPLYQKEQRILTTEGEPFRAPRALDLCIEEEVNHPDIKTPETHLAWLDRMKKCSAQFQDTHLELTSSEGTPWISLGITLREWNGRFYIESLYPQFLAQQNGVLLLHDLQPGTEVTALDGRPIEHALNELLPLIGGSSLLYRRQEALRRLTERNFFYPDSPHATLQLTQQKSLNLTWAADFNSSSHVNSRTVLQQRGFTHSDELPWLGARSTPTTAPGLKRYQGYYEETPPLPPSALSRLRFFYEKTSLSPALSFVAVNQQEDGVQAPFCYLQLASFSDDRVTENGKKSRAYSKPLRTFLRQCQREKLPLVLDLRSNGGGYIALGSQAFSAVLPKRTRADARSTWAYRESELYQDIRDGYFTGQYWGENSLEVLPAERADRRVRGFSGAVLALTTPYCISSCDRLAALLKVSGRAQVLGSPTNGTGAGFTATWDPTTQRLQSDWRDSSGLLMAQIPDMLFGAILTQEVPTTSGRPNGFVPWIGWLLQGRPEAVEYVPLAIFGEGSLLENQPTQPDIPFEINSLDLSDGASAWLRKIQDTLQQPLDETL